jgi:hypothetical protein
MTAIRLVDRISPWKLSIGVADVLVHDVTEVGIIKPLSGDSGFSYGQYILSKDPLPKYLSYSWAA